MISSEHQLPARRCHVYLLLLLMSGTLAQVGAEDRRGELTLSAPGEPLECIYTLEGSTVVLTALPQGEGRLDLRVVVNGYGIDALYDPSGPVLEFDGHNGAVTLTDRKVLATLALELEVEWKAAEAPLSLDRHLVSRLVNFLSEAPVGLELGRRTIELPDDVDPARDSRVRPVEPGQGLPATLCVSAARSIGSRSWHRRATSGRRGSSPPWWTT